MYPMNKLVCLRVPEDDEMYKKGPGRPRKIIKVNGMPSASGKTVVASTNQELAKAIGKTTCLPMYIPSLVFVDLKQGNCFRPGMGRERASSTESMWKQGCHNARKSGKSR